MLGLTLPDLWLSYWLLLRSKLNTPYLSIPLCLCQRQFPLPRTPFSTFAVSSSPTNFSKPSSHCYLYPQFFPGGVGARGGIGHAPCLCPALWTVPPTGLHFSLQFLSCTVYLPSGWLEPEGLAGNNASHIIGI